MALMADTHFINVDLEVRAATDLRELAKALEPRTVVLFCGPLDDGFLATFELDEQPIEADSGMVGFLDLIDALPSDARRRWDAATRRDFSIGVQCGGDTHAFELAIAPATLARVAAAGAHVTFVVYGEGEASE